MAQSSDGLTAMALTAKQELFVREYLIDQNATQAAIRAGYASSGARTEGARLLANADIAAAVAEAARKVADKLDLSAERVLRAIAEIAYGDWRLAFDADGNLKRPSDMSDEAAATIAGIEFVTVSKGEGAVEHVAKIKHIDRLRALDMLARHHALYNDTLEVKVTDGLADRIARAKARGAAAALPAPAKVEVKP